MSVLSDILEDMFSYHRYALYAQPEDDQLFLEDHARIAAAIESGDATRAAEAMEEHLAHVKARYREDDSSHGGRLGIPTV